MALAYTDERCAINETETAKRTGISRKTLQKLLEDAQKAGLIHYTQPRAGTEITFLMPRTEASFLPLNTQAMQQRRAALEEAHVAVCKYISDENSCRQQALLAYFGEECEPCRRCDLCQVSKQPSEK